MNKVLCLEMGMWLLCRTAERQGLEGMGVSPETQFSLEQRLHKTPSFPPPAPPLCCNALTGS